MPTIKLNQTLTIHQIQLASFSFCRPCCDDKTNGKDQARAGKLRLRQQIKKNLFTKRTYILSNSKVMKYDTVLSKKITRVFIGSATLNCYLRLKLHFKFVSCLMVDCNY